MPNKMLLTDEEICDALNQNWRAGQTYYMPERLLSWQKRDFVLVCEAQLTKAIALFVKKEDAEKIKKLIMEAE